MAPALLYIRDALESHVLVARDPMTNPRIPFPMILIVVGITVLGIGAGLAQQFSCCEGRDRRLVV